MFVLTGTSIDVYDILTRERIGRDANDIGAVVSHDYYAAVLEGLPFGTESPLAYSGSFITYKKKLFMLVSCSLPHR